MLELERALVKSLFSEGIITAEEFDLAIEYIDNDIRKHEKEIEEIENEKDK